MRKIIDYTTITKCIEGNQVADNFEKLVKKAIDDGWQPYGDLKVERNDYLIILFQVMVKYEEPKVKQRIEYKYSDSRDFFEKPYKDLIWQDKKDDKFTNCPRCKGKYFKDGYHLC